MPRGWRGPVGDLSLAWVAPWSVRGLSSVRTPCFSHCGAEFKLEERTREETHSLSLSPRRGRVPGRTSAARTVRPGLHLGAWAGRKHGRRRARGAPVRGSGRRSAALRGPLEGWLVASKGLAALPRRRGATWPMAVAGVAVGRCRWRARPPCQPARGVRARSAARSWTGGPPRCGAAPGEGRG